MGTWWLNKIIHTQGSASWDFSEYQPLLPGSHLRIITILEEPGHWPEVTMKYKVGQLEQLVPKDQDHIIPPFPSSTTLHSLLRWLASSHSMVITSSLQLAMGKRTVFLPRMTSKTYSVQGIQGGIIARCCNTAILGGTSITHPCKCSHAPWEERKFFASSAHSNTTEIFRAHVQPISNSIITCMITYLICLL